MKEKLIEAFRKLCNEPKQGKVSAYKKINHIIDPTGICIANWRWDSNVNYVSYQTVTDRIYCVLCIETIFFKN